ncbi:hypothetical protein FACS1894139_03700 [Planctomycetales bacterium]|nr:hypothetical protein FACS1894107_16890 [Planctomycetales bacterium]GHS97707.1 hypothetical protein FACS1894108_04540 [Planctomycetales bacterium]GHT03434.1 hypothetical protein FACS1894139_03700 [Planctomycetales bacterium]GHV19114.1 hypothetical protein AGMMS49959_03040 [Planctomycetales bacterium]
MRQILKDEDGGKMLAPLDRRATLFQIAELGEREFGASAGVVNTYDPISDKVWLTLQLLNPRGGTVGDDALARWRALWREFL